jgi:hypothetical protein
MAFGYETQDVDQLLQELSTLSDQELQELIGDEANEADKIPDGHLVKYMEACIQESYKDSEERRAKDRMLWEAHESQMKEMNDKEDWQSRIVLNKPFTTCVQARSLVRRGLLDKQHYFGLESTNDYDESSKLLSEFWEKSLRYWLSTDDAFLPDLFSDSSEMGFAVGQSMATKIGWETNDEGISRLTLHNFPYWHTFPDPDRKPRKTWSGLYNIHEEWIDFHVLREKERQGFFTNINLVKTGKSSKSGSGYRSEDPDEFYRGQRKAYERNPYRKSVLVQEFWGTLLDENGEMTMRNCTFTVANGIVIRAVRENPYRKLRWPWVDFSPIPHVMNSHGYGIYESSLSLWKFQNNLLNLFIDNENFRINNMFEFDPTLLENPNDDEVYPGKRFRLRKGAQGPVVKPVLKGDSTIQDMEFMWALSGNQWENGTFITELLKGDSGGKRDKTATEITLKLQQSIGVFDSIGKDCERGIEHIVWAAKEVLATFHDDFDRPGFRDVFGDDPVWMALANSGELEPEVRMQALELDCKVRVRGISRLFRQSDEINRIKELLAVAGMTPEMLGYVKQYETIRKMGEELNQDALVMDEMELKEKMMRDRQVMIQNAIGSAISGAQGMQDGQPAGNGQPVQEQTGA